MSYPLEASVKVKNYKCFGDDLVGFDDLYPVNIIIGRNNTGKSALIELVDFAISIKEFGFQLGHRGKNPEVHITKKLTEAEIRKVFPSGKSDGVIGSDHFRYASQWIGKPITFHLTPTERKFVSIDPPFQLKDVQTQYAQRLVESIGNPFVGKVFRRLFADRDIMPETDGSHTDMTENGRGATNMIQMFYNKANKERSTVEADLLNALNEICKPDSFFTRILVRQQNNNEWEIFLEETNKGFVALSQSGSGLKTIILVLVHLILLPKFHGKKLNEYIFAFEELENNLHPGLQRRLLNYIRKIAIEQDCCFILTTHSNVVIDLFSKDDKAQIIHTTHDSTQACAKRVQTYIHNRGVMDDLDVRASDLLQANGIVWVEGPSDRLYFNTWMRLCSDGKLKEGAHYQCIFYGGRLLSHLSAAVEPDENEINMLRVNKNAILLMDSDKRNKAGRLNTTKKRIKSEIEAIGGYSWVTNGREIENYIPLSAMRKKYPEITGLKRVKQYQDFASYLNKIRKGDGNKFRGKKVLFADAICQHITSKEELKSILDFKKRVEAVCSLIRKWNNL